MAEILTPFDTPIRDESGTYHARAVGNAREDGMWQGWIEFVPIDGTGETLVTAVETTQPERSHLMYWATGLTPVYLEGALRRARNPVAVHVRVAQEPVSHAPARRPIVVDRPIGRAEPILDPFEIGERSLDILRQELTALNRPRLFNIITAFELNPAGRDLNIMTTPQLVLFIVAAVEARLAQRVR